MEYKEKELFYKGIQKKCSNCFYFRWRLVAFNKCLLHPNILLSDAVDYCKFEKWQPNQKMYDYQENIYKQIRKEL